MLCPLSEAHKHTQEEIDENFEFSSLLHVTQGAHSVIMDVV